MREDQPRWGFVLVAGAAGLWGTDALFRRGLALTLPAATVVAWEHLLLVLLMLPALRRGLIALRSASWHDRVAVVMVGVGASALATFLFTLAFRGGDPTTPLLLQKLQPLVAVAGARVLLGEQLMPRFGVFVALGLAGAWLVGFPDPAAVSLTQAGPAFAAAGAAALWGMGTVLGRHLSSHVAPVELTALRFGLGLPAAMALSLVDGGVSSLAVGAGDVVPLVLLALVPGLLALLTYYRGLARTPASAATLAELAFPVTATGLNYLVFGAVLTRTQWLGLIVLAGTIVAMSRVRAPREVGIRAPAVATGPFA